MIADGIDRALPRVPQGGANPFISKREEVIIYKIFKVQITQYGPPATLIVTTSSDRGGPIKSESYCVFPEPHPGKSFSALRFDRPLPHVIPIEPNHDFVFDEVIGQARIDIARHIENHYPDKSVLAHNGEVKLQEVDSSYLVYLWVRRSASFLAEVCTRTSCEALRELILPILALPTVARPNAGGSSPPESPPRPNRERPVESPKPAGAKWALFPALKRAK